jgi:hypothetical protein
MYWITHSVGGDEYNGGSELHFCFHYYQDWLMLSLQIVVAQDSLIYLALQFLISYIKLPCQVFHCFNSALIALYMSRVFSEISMLGHGFDTGEQTEAIPDNGVTGLLVAPRDCQKEHHR